MRIAQQINQQVVRVIDGLTAAGLANVEVTAAAGQSAADGWIMRATGKWRGTAYELSVRVHDPISIAAVETWANAAIDSARRMAPGA